MASEVDINKTIRISEEYIDELSKHEFDPTEWECYQTDINLHCTVFFNPIYWLRVRFFWNDFMGYGFAIGPVTLFVTINRLVRPKGNENN